MQLGVLAGRCDADQGRARLEFLRRCANHAGSGSDLRDGRVGRNLQSVVRFCTPSGRLCGFWSRRVVLMVFRLHCAIYASLNSVILRAKRSGFCYGSEMKIMWCVYVVRVLPDTLRQCQRRSRLLGL